MTRRLERINELLRQEISALIRRELKDPRVGGLVSITEVQTAPDLRSAKVFVSIMGEEEERRATMDTLERAARFFRKELGLRVRLRHTPALSFQSDESIARGDRVLRLLRGM